MSPADAQKQFGCPVVFSHKKKKHMKRKREETPEDDNHLHKFPKIQNDDVDEDIFDMVQNEPPLERMPQTNPAMAPFALAFYNQYSEQQASTLQDEFLANTPTLSNIMDSTVHDDTRNPSLSTFIEQAFAAIQSILQQLARAGVPQTEVIGMLMMLIATVPKNDIAVNDETEPAPPLSSCVLTSTIPSNEYWQCPMPKCNSILLKAAMRKTNTCCVCTAELPKEIKSHKLVATWIKCQIGHRINTTTLKSTHMAHCPVAACNSKLDLNCSNCANSFPYSSLMKHYSKCIFESASKSLTQQENP